MIEPDKGASLGRGTSSSNPAGLPAGMESDASLALSSNIQLRRPRAIIPSEIEVRDPIAADLVGALALLDIDVSEPLLEAVFQLARDDRALTPYLVTELTPDDDFSVCLVSEVSVFKVGKGGSKHEREFVFNGELPDSRLDVHAKVFREPESGQIVARFQFAGEEICHDSHLAEIRLYARHLLKCFGEVLPKRVMDLPQRQASEDKGDWRVVGDSGTAVRLLKLETPTSFKDSAALYGDWHARELMYNAVQRHEGARAVSLRRMLAGGSGDDITSHRLVCGFSSRDAAEHVLELRGESEYSDCALVYCELTDTILISMPGGTVDQIVQSYDELLRQRERFDEVRLQRSSSRPSVLDLPGLNAEGLSAALIACGLPVGQALTTALREFAESGAWLDADRFMEFRSLQDRVVMTAFTNALTYDSEAGDSGLTEDRSFIMSWRDPVLGKIEIQVLVERSATGETCEFSMRLCFHDTLGFSSSRRGAADAASLSAPAIDGAWELCDRLAGALEFGGIPADFRELKTLASLGDDSLPMARVWPGANGRRLAFTSWPRPEHWPSIWAAADAGLSGGAGAL